MSRLWRKSALLVVVLIFTAYSLLWIHLKEPSNNRQPSPPIIDAPFALNTARHQVNNIQHAPPKRLNIVNRKTAKVRKVPASRGSAVVTAGDKSVNAADDSIKGLKKIIYWNDAYGDQNFFFGSGRAPFVEHGCAVDTCYATHNRTMFNMTNADAVLWHPRAKDKTFPETRSPHTFYVFWMIESALYAYVDLEDYNDTFNWTSTYRMDSDFPIPYGRIENLGTQPRTPNTRNYAEGKTKLAAWFVSNCHTVSGREILARTLQQHLTVDVYGKCGSYACDDRHSTHCYDMVEKDYKFYFSFENSLCYGYVTEKFFTILKHDIIPVVYGLGYDSLDLPPHSYIDVLSFRSVKVLAEYLQYLDRNDTAYNEYFRWKTDFEVETGNSITAKMFCDLCQRLHDVESPIAKKRHSERLRYLTTRNRNNASSRNKKYDVLRNSPARNIAEDKEYTHLSRSNGIYESYNISRHIKYEKLYVSMKDWFLSNQCTDPYTNMHLAAFIHGSNISQMNEQVILREEEVLPFLLRPHTKLWK